jgi:hypothetical protein
MLHPSIMRGTAIGVIGAFLKRRPYVGPQTS